MPRPPLESVLQVIGGATPLLEELRASRANLDKYIETAQNYQDLISVERSHINDIMLRLQTFADEFIKLYKDAEAGPPDTPPDPDPTPNPDPGPEPTPDPDPVTP